MLVNMKGGDAANGEQPGADGYVRVTYTDRDLIEMTAEQRTALFDDCICTWHSVDNPISRTHEITIEVDPYCETHGRAS